MSADSKYYTEDIKKISHIEFNVFTNKEIKSYSAVSSDPFGINLAESYENYEPKKGGLVDLRLGTCDPYLNCTTCGQNYMECQGHSGHIQLAEQVFHYGFLDHLKSLLQCVCIKCSNILIEKSDAHFKKAMLKKAEARFKEIKNLTKNINFCWNCGTSVPKIKKELNSSKLAISLLVEREIGNQITDDKTGETKDETKKIIEVLSPRDCYNILRNFSDTDCFLLGFNPKVARPEDLIIHNFPVPPVIIRPTSKIDFIASSTMEDALTLKISEIVTANQRLRTQLDKETINNQGSSFSSSTCFAILQYQVTTFFDNEIIQLPRTEFKTGGQTKSISSIIKGKAGRVRSNLMGKRVDFSGRSVITPDPYINIDQLGIPKKIAIELTIPEEVTPYNIKHLTQLVKNGPEVYPGANFVLRVNYRDGKSEFQKIDLKYRKKEIRLNIGDIVERHSINGDFVLFNRQPTLHKPSMMAHSIHVLDIDDVNTFRVNVSACKPYGADFDGDEMNIHLAQSIQARNELKYIANVKYQIVGVKDSNPIIGCQQDALSGAYLLTQKTSQIKGSDALNILANTSSETKMKIDPNKMYSGHEVFSHIIPAGINSIKKNDEGVVTFQIKDGDLLTGLLDKFSLSTSKNSIIHFIWDKYGPDKTRMFIDDVQKLVLNYLLQRGLSIGFRDCFLNAEFESQIKKILNNTILENKYILTQYENDLEQISPQIIEASLYSQMNAIGTDIGATIKNNLDISNYFWAVVSSGAKGSETNLQQMMGCIGQQSLESVRILKKIEGRSLVYFHKDDDTPEARGFTRSSLLDGLMGYEAFIFTAAGREGLIDTAIKSVTWETPIIIIENNIPKYTEIGKWIDDLLDNNLNKVKHYTDRQMELLDTNNIYIPTTNEDGVVSWGEITAITRHDPGTELYKIKTKNGRSVIVTESKSLLIWDKENNKFTEMLTPDIKVGDYVPVTMDLCDPPIIKTRLELTHNTIELDNVTGYLIGLYMGGKYDDRLDNLNGLVDYIQCDKLLTEAFVASKDFIIGLLRGYVSECSYIGNNAIIINGSSIELINGLSMLCSRLGIFSSIVENKLRIYGKWAILFSDIVDLYKNEFFDVIEEGHNNVILDEIIEITLVDVKDHPKVYDLTIPSTLNFGLANGLQVRDTAQTGYIQRKLIKGLEDLSIKYDGTNRNSRGVIVQYVYGENGINQACQTEIKINLMNMDNKKIESSFSFTDEQIKKIEKTHKISKEEMNNFNDKYVKKMVEFRDKMRLIQMKFTLNFKTMEDKFLLPINLFRLAQDYSSKGENLELKPQDVLDSIEEFFNSPDTTLLPLTNKSNNILKKDDRAMKFILEMGVHEYLSPNKCIFEYGLTKETLTKLWSDIKLSFIKAIAEPGEMVGILAAQSVGEPTTQLNLNTKHFAGVAAKSGASSGVPRVIELLSYSKDIKTPQMRVYFDDSIAHNKNAVNKIASYFKFLSIKQLITSAEIYYSPHGLLSKSGLNKKLLDDNVSTPFFVNNQKADLNSLPFIFRIKMNIEKMLDKETTLLDIKTKFISYWYKNFMNTKTMKRNEKEIFNKISRCAILSNTTADKEQIIHVRFSLSSFNYPILVDFLNIILNNITLKGIDGIDEAIMEESRVLKFNKETGVISTEKEYVVTTNGINLEKLKYMKDLNHVRTSINDVQSVYKSYGIEATRQILMVEFMKVLGDKLNSTHVSLLVDMMTHNGDVTAIDRHGLSKLDSDPCARASFEQTMDHFINAAIFNEKDTMKSVSSNVMFGKVIPGGTGCFDLMLDTHKLENSEYTTDESGGRVTFIPLEEDSLLKDIFKYGVNEPNFFIPV